MTWWIYLVVIGILFSGFMTVRNANEEKEVDEYYIEQEGKVYIERMEREKQTRREVVKSGN